MKTFVFDSHNKKEYLARLVLNGDWYGRDGCLENQKGAMIEFYVFSGMGVGGDLKWAGIKDPYYFVARYYIDTFFGISPFSFTFPVKDGLLLDGAQPDLSLSAGDCKNVGRFILEELQK